MRGPIRTALPDALFAVERDAAEPFVREPDYPSRWPATGVAVANAHPALLAVADEITTSNDADGVASVLAAL